MTLIEYVAIVVAITMISLFFPSILAAIWTCVVVVMQAVVLILAAVAVIVTLSVILNALFSNEFKAGSRVWKF